MTLGPI